MDTHVVVSKDRPKTSHSRKKRSKKPGVWKNLSRSNKVSLVLILALLIIFPVALFAMLSPKIPLFSGASSPVTPITPPVVDYCNDMSGNLIKNYNFEEGKRNWSYSKSIDGRFSVVDNDYSCKKAAYVKIKRNANGQLYQHGIDLEPNTTYKFSFAARASVVKTISVILHKHRKSYTQYGIQRFDLNSSWKEFATEFTTPATIDDNTRLRFWFNGKKGEEYFIDNVVLKDINDITPTVTSTPTLTVGPSVSPTFIPTPTFGPTNLPTTTSTPTISPTPTTSPAQNLNIIRNYGFEVGKNDWNWYSNGTGSFSITSLGVNSSSATMVNMTSSGRNVQLYQINISLKPSTAYELSFDAKANKNATIPVSIHKHTSPYTNYGLKDYSANFTTDWNNFSIVFTSPSSAAGDARLRFWFANKTGTFYLDNVTLQEL